MPRVVRKLDSAPAVFAVHRKGGHTTDDRNPHRNAFWRRWLGDDRLDLTYEWPEAQHRRTDTFMFDNTGKRWRIGATLRHEGVAPDDDWITVVFEEGARTREFVQRWNANPSLDLLRTFTKRVLVRIRVPAPPPRRIVRDDFEGFRWVEHPIFYYGVKVTTRMSFLGDRLDARVEMVWDLQKTDETPNPFAISCPPSPFDEDYEEDIVRYANNLVLTYNRFSVGRLKRALETITGDDRLDPQTYARRLVAFLEDKASGVVEWRTVLERVEYSSFRIMEGDRLTKTEWSVACDEPMSPLLDLPTFTKKADSPEVKKMPAWSFAAPAFEAQAKEKVEAERVMRDELKRSLVEKVFHPERANRMGEMYGLSMDEYMDRL